MTDESRCSQMWYPFLFVLAVLVLVVWMVMRFTSQCQVTTTEKI